MRFGIALLSLVFITGCNSVEFSPSQQEQPSTAQSDPIPSEPLPVCLEGARQWVAAADGQTQCPSACSDGSHLQCAAKMEKELVCANNSYVESGATRIASVGDAIGACPVATPPPPVVIPPPVVTPPPPVVTPPPPAPVCVEGTRSWAPGGSGTTPCPDACWDGSRLQCMANLEKEMICSNNAIVPTGNTRVASVGAAIGACPVKPPATKTVTEKFTAQKSKIDILLLLDTTPSMFDDLEKLSKRLGSMTSKLGDVDWQVAITNAGVGTDYYSYYDSNGKFMEIQDLKPAKTILHYNDPHVEDYFRLTVGYDDNLLRDNHDDFARCAYQPFCMYPNPEPLHALKKAIDLRKTDNAGFFRKDAWLVPVIISDADENEDGKNPAYTPAQIVDYYNQQLSSTMKGMVGVGIVVKPNDPACLSNESWGGHVGTHAVDFAKRTEGVVMSLCDADYAAGLNEVSDNLRKKVSFFDIAQIPAEGDISVKLTPAVTGMTWTRVGRRVQFSKPLPPNTKIEISYKVKAN